MNIGVLNEGPLHQALKAHYAPAGARLEVDVGGFVADVCQADGRLFEIQTSGFSSLRRKLESVLERRSVVLVHPVARTRHIVKLPESSDEPAARRRSPKRGTAAHVLTQLVSLPRLLEHPRFELEVVLIEEEELRRRAAGRRAWRRNGWEVVQRRLVGVLEQRRFATPDDLLSLVHGPLPERFTTAELAAAMGEPRRLAQKLAYCLRETGRLELCGKQGNALQYRMSLNDRTPR